MTDDEYKRHKRLKHKPSTLSLSLTILGVIICIYAIHLGYTKTKEDKYSGQTKAMIYTVRCNEKENKCNVVVKYTIDNINYTGDLTTVYPSPFTINQEIVLYYDPNNKTDISTSLPPRTVGYVIIGVSVIVLLNLIWYLHTQYRLLQIFKYMGY